MAGRLPALVVATLLMPGVAHATNDEASFHCVVRSAYYLDTSDQLAPDKEMNWERTKIDVLIHDGKALVTHQLFGFSNPVTDEFSILQYGGAEKAWTLLSQLQGLGIDDQHKLTRPILISIRTWGLKDYATPIRFYVDYPPAVMLGTCERTSGEVGYDKK
jgi:hypothetical protein